MASGHQRDSLRNVERPFSFEADEASGRLVLHGDLDEGAALTFRSVLADLTDGYQRDLVVNLTDVDLLPSSAVGIIASARESAHQHGAEVSLVAADGTISARVLTICGLAYSTD